MAREAGTTGQNSDEAIALFWEKARGCRLWPVEGVLTCATGVAPEEILREVYGALAPEGRALPAAPRRSTTCRFDGESLGLSYVTDRGDGVLVLTQLRGFMPGAGATLTYLLRAGEEGFVEVEDWWEDNVADPATLEFHVRAPTLQEWERAKAALSKVLAARGLAPL